MKPETRRRWVQLAVSAVIAGSCVWVLRAGALPVIPPSAAFRNVRWWAIGGYLGLWFGVHCVRALRWHWLLLPVRRVRPGTLLSVSFVSFGAILLFPLRSGEFVRPLLLQRRAGVSGWAAAGAVGAERIADGLSLMVLLLVMLQVAVPNAVLPDRVGVLTVNLRYIPTAARATMLSFLAAFVVMGVFYWRREQARRLTERVLGVVSHSLARWIADKVARMAEGLGFLTSPRYSAPFLLATALYWLVNAACTWLLIWACGFDSVTYSQACVVMGVLALAFLFPNAPGFFGAFQISVYAGLLLYFPPPSVVDPAGAGAACVLLMYACQVGITFGAALGALALGGRDAIGEQPSPDRAATPDTVAE